MGHSMDILVGTKKKLKKKRGVKDNCMPGKYWTFGFLFKKHFVYLLKNKMCVKHQGEQRSSSLTAKFNSKTPDELYENHCGDRGRKEKANWRLTNKKYRDI